MSKKLSFNEWLMYYGDDVEDFLDRIYNHIENHNLEHKLLNNNIYYEFARIIYNNSYKGRPLNILYYG